MQPTGVRRSTFSVEQTVHSPYHKFPPRACRVIATHPRILAGLLTKLPLLQGLDKHDVEFVLCMASEYMHLPLEVADAVFQRANTLYLATHHGWAEAIAATAASVGTVASLAAIFDPSLLNRQIPQRRQQQRQTPLQRQQAPQ